MCLESIKTRRRTGCPWQKTDEQAVKFQVIPIVVNTRKGKVLQRVLIVNMPDKILKFLQGQAEFLNLYKPTICKNFRTIWKFSSRHTKTIAQVQYHHQCRQAKEELLERLKEPKTKLKMVIQSTESIYKYIPNLNSIISNSQYKLRKLKYL